MKYMLLIHQGSTPTPPSDAWDGLSDAEKGAVYGAYKAINETPGVTSGLQLQPPETATTVRVEDGRTLTTDGPFAETKEALGGYLPVRGRRPRRGDRARRADPGGAARRRGRGAADRRVVALTRARSSASSGAACSPPWSASSATSTSPRRPPRRRSRSPPSAGRATACPTNPGALAGRDGPQPRDRPDPPRADAGGEDRGCWRCPRPRRTTMDDGSTFPDERLELIFTCCHPALAVEAQVALTLRTLGGLTTDEIARAFLVAEATMAQRLVRAKRKITRRGHPVPGPARPPAARPARGGARGRLPDLQRGLRRARRAWPPRRSRLGRRAGRADARRARGARPAGADAAARRAPRGARFASGELVLLADQDRTLWDRDADRRGQRRARRGRCALRRARRRTSLQAAIAALHARRAAPTGRRSPRSTASSRGSPARRWSSSTARSRSPRPRVRPAGLRSSTASSLDGYRYLHSTRAELLRRLDRSRTRPATPTGGRSALAARPRRAALPPAAGRRASRARSG